jgi:hypothetical protein
MTDTVSYFIGREDLYGYKLPWKEQTTGKPKEATVAELSTTPVISRTSQGQAASPGDSCRERAPVPLKGQGEPPGAIIPATTPDRQRLTSSQQQTASPVDTPQRVLPVAGTVALRGGPCPITFSVIGGHIRRVLDVGPTGIHIVATETGGIGQIRSTAWGASSGSSEAVVCDVDVLISAGTHQPKPASDLLLRVLKYIEAVDIAWRPKFELPVMIPAKILAESLSIELSAGRGTISLSIGGIQQAGAEWPSSDFRYSGTLQLARLRELVKLAGGGMPIIGVVPPVGDFPSIWYARVPGYGRLLMTL